MAAPRDYYQTLGVSETATTDEIKKAFRRLAKQFHPDRNPNKPEAVERFKEVNEAHDVLSDSAKRKKYDEMRRYGAFAGAGGGGWAGGGRPSPGGGAAGAGGGDFDPSDLGGFGGLGDLFSSIFGRRGESRGGRRRRGDRDHGHHPVPRRRAGREGADQSRAEGSLSHVQRSGAAPGATISTCPECRGRGVVSFGQGGFAVNRPCPVCRGKGKVPSQPCPTCHGSGDVRVEKRLMITVPPGTEDGTRMRLKGEGAKARGDIVVVFQVEPDRFFRREGLDVICVVPINVMQAMLGSKIKVKTLDGKRVVLRIPPGTQHGQKFRIPGQGIEKNGRRGDQYVEVRVEIPEHLTPEQAAAAQAFAERAGIKF